MQAIAAENNLAETAFFVREGADYALRWFTPTVEVDLCGHATLASGHVVFTIPRAGRESVNFRTMKAGTLRSARRADMLVVDFPWRARVARVAPAGTSRRLWRHAAGGAARPRSSRRLRQRGELRR